MDKTLEIFFKAYETHAWCQLNHHLPSELQWATKYDFFKFWENFIRTHVTESISQEELLEVTPHERLMEITLARLEAATPYKKYLKTLAQDFALDPKASITLLKINHDESTFYLNYARLSTNGPIGKLKIQGYTMTFAWTLRTWLHDTTTDMAPTMARLDETLTYCDRIMENYA